MATFAYANGYSENEIKNLVNSSLASATGYIKTTDGRFFAAKPRNYVWTHNIDEPHLEEVTAIFPNGRTAQYCANLNNGIATFIKFNN